MEADPDVMNYAEAPPSMADLTASLTEATAELLTNPPASAEQVLDAARIRHQSARTAAHQLADITSDCFTIASDYTNNSRELYGNVVESISWTLIGSSMTARGPSTGGRSTASSDAEENGRAECTVIVTQRCCWP